MEGKIRIPIEMSICFNREMVDILRNHALPYSAFPQSIEVGKTPFMDWIRLFKRSVRLAKSKNEFTRVMYQDGTKVYSDELNEWNPNEAGIDKRGPRKLSDKLIAHIHDHSGNNTLGAADVHVVISKQIKIGLVAGKFAVHMLLLSQEGQSKEALQQFRSSAPATIYDAAFRINVVWKELNQRFGSKLNSFKTEKYQSQYPYPSDTNEEGIDLIESVIGMQLIEETQNPLYFCQEGSDTFNRITNITQIFPGLI